MLKILQSFKELTDFIAFVKKLSKKISALKKRLL